MGTSVGIRQAYSSAEDARTAAREFHRNVAQPGMALVMFFCSSDYDLAILAQELSSLFQGVRVIGCTTGRWSMRLSEPLLE